MANGVAAVSFDPLTFVKRLTKAGLSVEAAETFATEQLHFIEKVSAKVEQVTSNVASKDELQALNREHKIALKEYKSEMKEDFRRLEASLETKMDAKFASVDAKFEILRKDTEAKLSANTVSIIKWMAGLMLTQVGLVFTILKLFVLP